MNRLDKGICCAFLLIALSACGKSKHAENSTSPFDRFQDASSDQSSVSQADSANAHQSMGESIIGRPQRILQRRFSRCGSVRVRCVVDGGIKIRIADIDTPELSQPKCSSEKELAEMAAARLLALLNEGPFEMIQIGNQDEDRYGRKLRVLIRNGKSIGDQLTHEGLARKWTGQREPWC